ncbi:hypothetical protein Nepgr_033188 [Nepenthes gracilis]|uniref:Phosphatidylinositol 4-phosphate 5-kinase n=1 Tax=Nepenthes gracilis TaxID=150966 RepID=A0AAD3TKR7_NEPGR|nr:hypothetical protein Nepgr_033188 [Nepenthes gracilis]
MLKSSVKAREKEEYRTAAVEREKESRNLGREVIFQPRQSLIRSRSQATTTNVTPTGILSSVVIAPIEPVTVEKFLPNGDLYIKTFLGNVPHGSGKDFWIDGKAKFPWPSGATCVGDYKLGQMEGADGDTYKGRWFADKTPGFAEKRGGHYEGVCMTKFQDEQGKFVWKKGNACDGEGNNGLIAGKGVLIWADGNRHDGKWNSGIPKVNGKNRIDSAYYPSSDMDLMLTNPKKWISIDCGGGESGGREIIFPSICKWESDGEAVDFTCAINDNLEASMIYREGILVLDGDGARTLKKSQCRFIEAAKHQPGETISKGHKCYDLMLNFQLGIRYSVGKHASMLRNLKPGNFHPKEKFWTRFPPEGSKMTPPHQSPGFRWKDYCPTVLRHLRELFQINPIDYMMAICGNDVLRELSSPGKSGSCFYLTQNGKFMIKTVRKCEVKVLIRMLPSYYKHVCRYENSLVTRFYGVHCVKPIGGQKTRFIVMENLLCSEYPIHRRFDLKGSSYGRTTEKLKVDIDETTTLKDLDLNFVFRLQTSCYQELIKQIERDCEFLQGERIMDYSLLVGVHFRDGNTLGKIESCHNEKFMHGHCLPEAELQELDHVLATRKPLIRLGTCMPARAERAAMQPSGFDEPTAGGVKNLTRSQSGEICEAILYFGMIDILQDYDISKKLEHAYKSFQVDSTSISAVDPKLYSKRFRDFIGRVFIKDN